MSIRKHIPARSKDTYKSLQVKMDAEVVEEVKLYMRLDGISWNDLLTACFMKYLDESRIVHGDKVKEKKSAKSSSTLIGIVTIITLMESPILQVVNDLSDFLV